MTAEWLHLPPPYPPGVGPLYGAELEAWYEDLQDILGSDTGGAKLARAPTCIEKEPEFLDVLESCSLTWLTDGNQTWGEGVQRATEEIHTTQPLHHTSSSSSSSSSSCMSPAVAEERKVDAESGRSGDSSTGSGSDLLPPEFFELLSEGGVGMVDPSGAVISGGYYYHHHHQHQHADNVHPASPSASEEELPCVPDSPSSSSSASQSPSQNCSPPSSPVSSPSPSVYSSSRMGKRKRTTSERGNSALSSFSSSTQRSPYSSTKKSRKEREQENERKVQELTEQNERLKAEIERLGEEVQRTRRALIERLVNTRK
ncbi:DNA damage-inducible transcript 3 protein [Leuresthes tenuis]|uniref:DNA damage-inducible transcript 3 protein n=1 Tax=Leuresthes tenuis TaxID=355514 RepID=UPI003B508B9C